ncbi:quinone oxidoreductase family protein [Blastococcus sp. SYSU DS0616]
MTQTPRTMKAAALDRFGGADALRMQELPVPALGPLDVLIRVEAAGVGSWDAVEREGAYDGAFGMPSTFPYVLGWDGAGTVAAVGALVTRFAAGDSVYAATMPLPRGGFYAEYAAVDQDHVAPVPSGLTIEQVAAMPWDALTALSGLDALRLEQGQSLMIFGASGGIGHLAVQLAVHQGVRVLAVASGDDGVALVSRLGAESAVNGRQEDVGEAAREFSPDGLDAALLLAGGETAERAASAVRTGGAVAFPNGVLPEPHVRPDVRLLRYDGARDQDATARLNALVEAGALQVHVDRVFDFEEVVVAHRALTSHYVGKLALRMS